MNNIKRLDFLYDLYNKQADRINSQGSCGDGSFDRQIRREEAAIATDTASIIIAYKQLLQASTES